MRFVFICGCLEPGRDGVGDYVRGLSNELAKQGHHISAIALNDHYILEVLSSNEVCENINVCFLRIPAVWKTSKRFACVGQWVNDFNPDWVSLQFVPFAFHKKGLPYTLAKQLHSLGQGRNWHIMFHELWVGMEREASVKHRIIGKAQQFIIKSLIQSLHPRVIHTQAHLYQIQLIKLGVTAYPLPLFGNIPVTNIASVNNTITMAISRSMSLVLFGNIHQSSFVQPLTEEAAAYARDTGTSLALVLIGRCGPEAENWVSAWKAAGLTVEILGEQSPSYISATLQKATFGLATTPMALIEKSGTAAAMREHGLRIICVGRPWHPRTNVSLRVPTGMAIYSPGTFKNCVAPNTVSLANENTVSFIAKQLLNDLINSN